MSDDEWAGVPAMDLTSLTPSGSSCSEDEGCSGDVFKATSDPVQGRSKVVRAKELLRVLRRFHRDHVKHVADTRDGYLDYHARNPRVRSCTRPAQKTLLLDGRFDQVGFVYDSILSEDFGRSCILELVTVDFNVRKSRPSPGVKRSLSLDDLDMMAQKNDQLDRRMLMLFGSEDNKPVGLKVLCDACYNIEKLECHFSRSTTILQDDRVIRRTTFYKEGKESIIQESVSFPRYYLDETLKMVDEYYSIQYAEGLFKRCNMIEIWKSLDFVHKKWLGEIIDYEYILVNNSLKSIPRQQNSKDSVSLYSEGMSRPSTMLISRGSENYCSSTGSLNNVLVEGEPMYNDSLNNSSVSKTLRRNKEDGTTASGAESNSLDLSRECRSTKKAKKNASNSTVKMRRYRVKSKAKYMSLSMPHLQRKVVPRKTSSRRVSGKRNMSERSGWGNESEFSEKTKVWVKGGRAWRKSVTPEVVDDRDVPGTSGLSADREARGRAKEVVVAGPRVDFGGKGWQGYWEEYSESTLSSSDYSGPDVKSEMTSTREDEPAGIHGRRGKFTCSKPTRTRSRKRSSKNGLTNYATTTSDSNLVLRLLSKELQNALSGERSRETSLNLAKCDSYIELQNFCVVFPEDQVLRRLHREGTRPFTMAEKIMKVIDDCKLACIRICQSSAPDNRPSSDEGGDSPGDDDSPPSTATSSAQEGEGEGDGGGRTSRPSATSSSSATSDFGTATPPNEDVESKQNTEETIVREKDKKSHKEVGRAVDESFTTDTVEEEYREDIGTFFLIQLLKYLWDKEGKHSLCACDQCLEFVQEMHRIIDGKEQPNSSAAWRELQHYLPDDVKSPELQRRPCRADEASDKMAAAVPSTGGPSLVTRSTSDGDPREQHLNPLNTVRRFLSHRRLVCFKTRKRRFRNHNRGGIINRIKRIRPNCRKSYSFDSHSSRPSFLNKHYSLEV